MSNAFVKFLESAGEKCSLHFPFSGKQQKPLSELYHFKLQIIQKLSKSPHCSVAD